MRIIKIYHLILFLFVLTLAPSFGRALAEVDSEYEEITYEDLLGRISNKKSYLKRESTSPFDDVIIHVGLGYITTSTETSIPNDSVSNRLSGIQLTLGINLFNPNWYSEANWKNYGISSSATREVSLRELDFRIGYSNLLSEDWNYKIGTGLSTRFLHFSNQSKSINYDSTTPALIVHFGLFSSISKTLSLGAEVSLASPLTASYDRGGWNLGFLTQGSF